jgi:uncharacterized protein YutE (UPF0331/DUF86 family)
MTPVKKEVMQKKLQRLSVVIRKLERYGAMPFADFSADEGAMDAAMFNLALGVEIVTDIGNHILAEQFQHPAPTYTETILSLGRHSVFPEYFAEENAGMPNFRNRLIHEYEDIDMGKVYEHLRKSPDTFREFARYYTEFFDTIGKMESKSDLFS